MSKTKMDNRLQTLFTGRQITVLKTVNSTNSYMSLLLAQQDLPEGTVVVSGQQTEGRGQAEERWLSEEGKNLLMSVVFYPSFVSPQNLFRMSKTFALAVVDFLCTLKSLQGKDTIKIKWPNDIYYGDKKLCGLLIENSIRNPHVNHTILGVGLNVNQENFPPSLANPVSLKNILGADQDINECIYDLCNSLESRYLQLKDGHGEKIDEDYLSALYRFGEFYEYENMHENNREKFRAKITAIEDDGKIFLKRENGLIEKFDFKEVRFVI